MLTRSRALGLLASAPLAVPTIVGAQTSAIRVGSVPSDTYASPFFAYEAGFFKRAGLDVQLTPFASSGAAAAAVAGGALDVALTDITVIANAAHRGLGFVTFAGAGLYAPNSITTAFCVKDGSPFQHPKDFEGHAVAVVTLVSISSTAVKAWLTKGGADISKVQFVEMPFPEMAAALDRGTVAGAFISEPSLSQIPSTIKMIADPYSAIARTFLVSNWFSTRDWIAKNGETVKKLTGTIYDAARWSNGNRDKTAPILAKYARLPIEKVQNMRRSEYATSLTTALLQPVLDAALQYKVIAEQVEAASLMTRV